MNSRILSVTTVAFLAPMLAACDRPGPAAPLGVADARVDAFSVPGPPDHGQAGGLSGLSALLQVEDARLAAIAAGFVAPPEPDRQITMAIGVIRAAAASMAARAADLERVSGGSVTPNLQAPPDPEYPPGPCRAIGRLYPPGPCRVGMLGSIGNALTQADARLAGIQAGFQAPPEPDRPGVLADLANIKAAAMNLVETADRLVSSIGV